MLAGFSDFSSLKIEITLSSFWVNQSMLDPFWGKNREALDNVKPAEETRSLCVLNELHCLGILHPSYLVTCVRSFISFEGWAGQDFYILKFI